MPYKAKSELPDAVKALPSLAQEIYMAAFNAAFEQYADRGNQQEPLAHSTAWAAVKRKYEQRGDQWVAKESLQPVYAELIQEVGRRNAAADAARIQRIIEICRELIDSVDEDPDRVTEALIEAQSALEWLRTQEAVKTEDGHQLPAAAYAHVPDAEDSRTWQLPLWESAEKGVTRARLSQASASLSPGGFRGKRVDIPTAALPAVKRRIREAYRSVGVEEEDIPRWVREAERRAMLAGFTSMSEATVTAKGVARVVVIKPGFGNSADGHYYPTEVLARDYAVFEGAKMYANHQTESEENERPEGDIREWVASLKNVRYQEGVGIVGDAVIVEPWLQAKLAMLRDKNLLAEMGISIRAAGVGVKGKVEGKDANIVERITRVRSVDFVTEAGAGGAVMMYESNGHDYDVDIIGLDTLRERRPDLVKAVESGLRESIKQEVRQRMELDEKVKELETNIATLTQERDELQGKMAEAEKAQRVAEAKSIIDKAVGESKLPDVARARLLEQFKGSESADGLAEAIKAEEDYIAVLTEAGKPKGLGGKPAPDPQASKEALKESFMRLGMTEAQAKEAAAR